MKTPLEVLKECRQISTSIEFTLNSQTREFMNEIRLEINESLIKSIKNAPHLKEWIATFKLKKQYLDYFNDNKSFINFVSKHIILPTGFKLVEGTGFIQLEPMETVHILLCEE